MRKRLAVGRLAGIAVVGIMTVAGLTFLYLNLSGRLTGPKHDSPVIAIIDSGLDLQRTAKKFRHRLLEEPIGWNFYDSNGDIQDQTPELHGTRVAEAAARFCSECRILPIKITRIGAGIRPDDLGSAIRYAVKRGARVINLSFGVTAGSTLLEVAVAEAKASRVVLVTAAGLGLPNPFKPMSLEKLFPQAHPDAIVVANATTDAKPDELSNFGPHVDLAVIPSPTDKDKGSSFAAAKVSGLAGALIARHPELSPEEIRHALRAQSRSSASPDFLKIGFGLLEPEKFDPTLPLKNWAARAYRLPSGAHTIDLSASFDIRSAGAGWDCSSDSSRQRSGHSEQKLPKLRANQLKKGRARISFSEPFRENCQLKIFFRSPSGDLIESPVEL